MDDLGYSWPSWKFGMKRDDLFTKLHDQYNTFSYSIQDPEAFHHDVFELSNEARTEQEFHNLMADRREQRLKELNESLESAAVEIIANPKLIGTEQWSLALQLFRTKSLDSLVRYFSSYLPEGYFDRYIYHDASSVASSYSEVCSVNTDSTNPSTVADADAAFFPNDDQPVMTQEPLRIKTTITTNGITHDLPPSPSSMQSDGDMSSSEDEQDCNRAYMRRAKARSMSFSGSESEAFDREDRIRAAMEVRDDDETSQSDMSDSLSTSGSAVDTVSSIGSAPEDIGKADYMHGDNVEEIFEDEELGAAQLPMDSFELDECVIDSIESDTPTPKPVDRPAFLDPKTISSIRHREHSPKPHQHDHHTHTHRSHRSGSPVRGIRRSPVRGIRRSPEEASSRISKPLTDPVRTRLQGRRRGLDL